MSTEEIAIRPAALSDADSIAELCIQLGYNATAQVMRDRLKEIMGRVDTAVFVAQDSSIVAGWIHVSIRSTLESGESAEITGLVVHEAARGHGIGRSLVKRAENWAVALGYETVRVRTNVVRTAARSFYRDLGFEEIKQQVVFVKRLLAEK